MSNTIVALFALCVLTACFRSKSERIIFNDTETNQEIWQLSQIDSCMMPYFENQAFTYDDSHAVFSSNRDGTWKLYASDLTNGMVSKISDHKCKGRFSIFPTGDEVAFMENGVLYAINVKTKLERVLFDANGKVEEEYISCACLFTNDGDYTTILGYNDNNSASIYRIRFSTNEIQKVYSSTTGLSHPMINPEYPNLITFVCKPDRRTQWELPREQRARGMLINTDTNTIIPFVMSDIRYKATHETWSKDGERLYYFDKIHRYSKPIPNEGWEVCVVSIDRNGGDKTIHYQNNSFKLSHGIASNDGRYFVCDVERPQQNPMFLLDFRTGEAKILCWPNQSQLSPGNVQSDHVHPSFSRSGRYIAYTSDCNSIGVPQAFAVPLFNNANH